ncbi:Putative glucose sorbosone dehydrogenase [Corynebacterium glyciniphilum AJ 3170]|uniref:Putative glucose sorbosone dehydrogenase n=1 Tax=Corynebacterium glyciniphilum AJ 3170 TaxID=1404245 RepID=X5DQW2_9CORY|nr:PQQ-dependent sugar dehydrogenase [Corynebacterium glyciniphilum]AHW63659.1 Putative glucose sorbosone dehydrogenase [Corynebacterium glyciniphilum AJ 3170]
MRAVETSYRRPIAVGALAALLAAAGCSSEGTDDPPVESTAPTSSGAPAPSDAGEATEADFADPEVVAEGLDAPWSLAFTDEGVPLLSERDSARILELDETGEPRELAVVEDAAPRGEGGLLGIAVHESYLYAYYTAEDDNRISRFELSGQSGALEVGEAETVLDGLPAAGHHNGGRIAFGPDGMLYAAVGDAGTTARAQDLDSLSGKILRMGPDGSVPGDNPFEDTLVYSYGHRNPQGIGWGPDGTMYASEFGQDTWDELNLIEPGENYGWPDAEGITGDDAFTDPVQQWEPAEASPSGITVTGDAVYIANLRGERIIEVPLDDTSASSEHLVGEHGRLRDVVTAPDGSLWILTNNTDGRGEPGPGDDRILRITLPD